MTVTFFPTLQGTEHPVLSEYLPDFQSSTEMAESGMIEVGEKRALWSG